MEFKVIQTNNKNKTMLTINFNLKVLHIAINVNPELLEDKLVHTGIVYNTKSVFSKVNTSAEGKYADFFQSKKLFKIICVETEMGPGEMVKLLEKKFNAKKTSLTGGMIASFTIDPNDAEMMYKDLFEKSEEYLKSEEKKLYA